MVQNVTKTPKKRVIRKEPVDFHINEKTIQESGKPVDFSFRHIKSFESLGLVKTRFSRIHEIPIKTGGTFWTRAIWLNNNKLTTVHKMDNFVRDVIKEPEMLAWIDVSFNYIKNVGETILKYKKLKILYLHGNLIDSFDEIVKLKELKQLRNLTLHGNPISKHPNYRAFVITVLPQIANLDFIPILRSERMKPSPTEALKYRSR